MDGIKEMLDRLSDLNEGELSDLESKIIGEFETVEKQEPTAQVVDSMTALADALDAVRGEQSSRVVAQQDLEQRAAEAAARVRPADEEPTDEEGNPVDPIGDAEVPLEELPAEEEDEEELKKKAAPTTFAEAPAPTEPAAEAAAPDPVETVAEVAPVSTETAAPPPEVEPTRAEVVTPEATPVPTTTEPAATSTNPPAQNEEIPVAASATDVVVTPPADNRPVPRQRANVSITAGADVPGYSAGTELTSPQQVADAFVKRLHNLARVSQPNGQQYTVATITASFPEERQLHDGDVDGNWAKIQNVAGTAAIVAAAGACIPLEIKYDIDTLGTTDTPVIDSLPRFTADRGGIRFYPSPLLVSADYAGALGVYDPVTGNVVGIDGAPLDPPNEKPCIPIECLPFEEAVLEAVTMCMCFDNLTGRVFPELVKAHNDLAMVQHARVTEQFILEKIRNGSTTVVNATGVLGAAREILSQVDRVAAVLRYNNRISPTASFRAIFPYWLKDMIRSDIAYQMPGDNLDNTMALADNKLDQWFRARNINVTWSLETSQSATGMNYVPSPLEDIDSPGDVWPEVVEWDMFAEGTWLVLDGGTLDLGVIRDSSHVANNTYCEFTESFYNAVRVGGESVHVSSKLCPSGAASALVPNPC